MFNFFSTLNRVPQIILGMGRVIYHMKVLSVVIGTKKFFSVEKFKNLLQNFLKIFEVNFTNFFSVF